MNGRGWFFGLAACLTAGGLLVAAEQRTEPADAEADNCVTKCGECRAACLACVDHCLSDRPFAHGHYTPEDRVRACLDCADICGACGSISARKGPMAATITAACAEACEKCALVCGEAGDKVTKACAERCRACAEACKAEAGD